MPVFSSAVGRNKYTLVLNIFCANCSGAGGRAGGGRRAAVCRLARRVRQHDAAGRLEDRHPAQGELVLDRRTLAGKILPLRPEIPGRVAYGWLEDRHPAQGDRLPMLLAKPHNIRCRLAAQPDCSEPRSVSSSPVWEEFCCASYNIPGRCAFWTA